MKINGMRIELVPDTETESYEPFTMVAYDDNGRRAWSEGVRKDRSEMRNEYRGPIEAELARLRSAL